MKTPQKLLKGDCIGIICPSGFMELKKVNKAIITLETWGYKVRVGKTVGNQHNYFSGTDDERLEDLQQMLDDKNIKAIFCARGGYGLTRIIDKINFTKFKKNPKWIIGYSDITLLQSHIFRQYKIATMHSPMAAAFNEKGDKNIYIQSLQKAFVDKKANYKIAANELNSLGTSEGVLIGGNLSLIIHTIGTSSQYSFKNKILFIEDIGEYIYNVDRMLLQLKRAGFLKDLKGLIIGGFTDMKDTIIPFGKSVYEVIREHVAEYNYPICFNFPVGHQTENYVLKIGCHYKLSITKNRTNLKEQ